MADPMRDSGSVPEPGPGPVPLPSRNFPSAVPSRAERRLPQREKPLDGAAEKMGAMIGNAVQRVRMLPRRATELKHRLTIVRSEKSEEAAEVAAEVRQTARQQARHLRMRIEVWADEKPFQVITAAAGAAFVLGFLLRIWRSNHAGR